MKKKIVALSFAAALVTGGVFAASHVQAYGGHGNGHYGNEGHYGGHYGNGAPTQSTITDAQRTAARTLVDNAQKTLEPLRQQIFVKRQELMALQGAATPDVNAVSKAATELTALQQKFSQEQEKLGAELDKALGLEAGTHSFTGHGYGMGHNGGRGMGRNGGNGGNGGHGNYQGTGHGRMHNQGHGVNHAANNHAN